MVIRTGPKAETLELQSLDYALVLPSPMLAFGACIHRGDSSGWALSSQESQAQRPAGK